MVVEEGSRVSLAGRAAVGRNGSSGGGCGMVKTSKFFCVELKSWVLVCAKGKGEGGRLGEKSE